MRKVIFVLLDGSRVDSINKYLEEESILNNDDKK